MLPGRPDEGGPSLQFGVHQQRLLGCDKLEALAAQQTTLPSASESPPAHTTSRARHHVPSTGFSPRTAAGSGTQRK
jgi:hypothetical protein